MPVKSPVYTNMSLAKDRFSNVAESFTIIVIHGTGHLNIYVPTVSMCVMRRRPGVAPFRNVARFEWGHLSRRSSYFLEGGQIPPTDAVAPSRGELLWLQKFYLAEKFSGLILPIRLSALAVPGI